MDKLGPRIRDLRKARGRTLAEVAAGTGLTIGFLSQAERGIATPSLSSLSLIAGALGVPMAVFLDGSAEATAAGAPEPVITLGEHSAIYRRLTGPHADPRLEVLAVRLPPGFRSETSQHQGEEFAYVLSGTVTYVIAGKAHRLAAGQSLHFVADRRHHYENATDDWAEILSVGTMRLFV